MRNLITCIGEVLVDFLPIDGESGSHVGFNIYPGGSPFNVALGLARLGERVAFASKISSDLFGRFLLERIEKEGIDTRFLLTSSAPCTLAFVAMERGEPAYAFYDAGAADSLLTPDEVSQSLLDETGILAFGSISLLRGTTPETIVSIAERLAGHALLLFDPNIRPGLVADEAEYRALLDHIFSLADIIKISSADIAWLFPGISLREAALSLLGYGPALLVITQGSLGVLALRGNEEWAVPAFQLEAVDSVGAGDAFTAGLIASLARRGIRFRASLHALGHNDFTECLKYASATAAITCTRHGADPPTSREVTRFLHNEDEYQRNRRD